MLARFKPFSKKVTKDYLKQGYYNIYIKFYLKIALHLARF